MVRIGFWAEIKFSGMRKLRHSLILKAYHYSSLHLFVCEMHVIKQDIFIKNINVVI